MIHCQPSVLSRFDVTKTVKIRSEVFGLLSERNENRRVGRKTDKSHSAMFGLNSDIFLLGGNYAELNNRISGFYHYRIRGAHSESGFNAGFLFSRCCRRGCRRTMATCDEGEIVKHAKSRLKRDTRKTETRRNINSQSVDTNS